MKKLKKVKELIKKLKFNLKELAKYGFRKRYTNSASVYIWINDKRGIVVKEPYIVRKLRNHPKFAIPTISFCRPKKDWWKYGESRIFIQPLAVRTSLDKAFCRLADLGCRGSDFKRANIGWYRGKPVLIDW